MEYKVFNAESGYFYIGTYAELDEAINKAAGLGWDAIIYEVHGDDDLIRVGTWDAVRNYTPIS